MRLLFIRHGEPDYSVDSLTEKGFEEAALLADYLSAREKIDEIFVSPLGRAIRTCEPTAAKLGLTPTVKNWLEEVPHDLVMEENDHLLRLYPESDHIRDEEGRMKNRQYWDAMPTELLKDPRYIDTNLWRETEVTNYGPVLSDYDRITAAFDELLGEHGYVRDGLFYKVEKENTDTIAFFCHFGVTCMFLSHMLHISPFTLWHFFCAAPSSITEVVTEQRTEDTAIFRLTRFGDITHLASNGVAPSRMARFSEVYSDDWRR